jgi:hypothetical protein
MLKADAYASSQIQRASGMLMRFDIFCWILALQQWAATIRAHRLSVRSTVVLAGSRSVSPTASDSEHQEQFLTYTAAYNEIAAPHGFFSDRRARLILRRIIRGRNSRCAGKRVSD